MLIKILLYNTITAHQNIHLKLLFKKKWELYHQIIFVWQLWIDLHIAASSFKVLVDSEYSVCWSSLKQWRETLFTHLKLGCHEHFITHKQPHIIGAAQRRASSEYHSAALCR